MILIALETTGKSGSLAIMDGETAIWQHQLAGQKRSAAEITVQLDAALGWSENAAKPIQGIAVAVGPGSFTGLRIAITTAKMLAYALDLLIVPVGSLAAIAAVTATSDSVSQVLVGLNAYRGQVFAAEFSAQELQPGGQCSNWSDRVQVWPRAQWDQHVNAAIRDAETAITGDRAILGEDKSAQFADRIAPDAVGVGRVAARLIADQAARGQSNQPNSALVDAFSLAPRYVKLSAAELKATGR